MRRTGLAIAGLVLWASTATAAEPTTATVTEARMYGSADTMTLGLSPGDEADTELTRWGGFRSFNRGFAFRGFNHGYRSFYRGGFGGFGYRSFAFHRPFGYGFNYGYRPFYGGFGYRPFGYWRCADDAATPTPTMTLGLPASEPTLTPVGTRTEVGATTVSRETKPERRYEYRAYGE
jgi:hypothetical protein